MKITTRRAPRLAVEAFEDRLNPSSSALPLSVGDVLPSDGLEVVTGARPGANPTVTVWDILQESELASFLAYESDFQGGVNVATGPLTAARTLDIVTGAGAGGGPVVAAFTGNGTPLARFLAYESDFRGGISVAMGDVTGDGVAEIITGAGTGGGPVVAVFNAQGDELSRFYAFEPEFRGGIQVAVGDVNGSGVSDIVVGAGPGGGPVVKVFDARGELYHAFYAYDPSFTGGVNISTFGHRRVSELAVAPATQGAAHIQIYDLVKRELIESFYGDDPARIGGWNLALAGSNAEGDRQVLTTSSQPAAVDPVFASHTILTKHTWDNDFYLYFKDRSGNNVGSNVNAVWVTEFSHTSYTSGQPAGSPEYGYGDSTSDGRVHILWEVGHKGSSGVANDFSSAVSGGTASAIGIRDDEDQKTATGMPETMNFWVRYKLAIDTQEAGVLYLDMGHGMVGADKWKVFKHLVKDVTVDVFKDTVMEELEIPEEIAETVSAMDAVSDAKETWRDSENNYYYALFGTESAPARKVNWGNKRGDDPSAIIVPLTYSNGVASDYYVLVKTGTGQAAGSASGNGANYVDVFMANFTLR